VKKLTIIYVGLSLAIATSLFASGNHKHNETETGSINNHMGDHMHNGKMMNHSNPNGMTNEQMKKMHQNNHKGDHMHNGKMMNHSNPNGMTNEQMKNMKH